MKDRTQAPDPVPVDFPPHPGSVTPDQTVDVMVFPQPDPNNAHQLVVTFQPVGPQPTNWPDPEYLYVMSSGITLFNLYLDNASSYVFFGKGVTLSSDTPTPDLNYYFNPYFDPRISTKHVAFMAQYIGDNWAHVDPILLFIKDPTHPLLFSEPTDPDILNPGDHPKLTSGG